MDIGPTVKSGMLSLFEPNSELTELVLFSAVGTTVNLLVKTSLVESNASGNQPTFWSSFLVNEGVIKARQEANTSNPTSQQNHLAIHNSYDMTKHLDREKKNHK